MTYSQNMKPGFPNQEFAFEQLLKRCQPLIHSSVQKYMIVFQERVTQELVHECRKAIWLADQSFDPDDVSPGKNPDDLFNASLRTAIKKQLDQYVKKKSVKHYQLVQETNHDYKLRQERIPQKEPLFQLSFPSFTETEYNFYRMYMIHGYSISQIARKHRVTAHTVHNWRRQTMNTLRNHFGQN